MCVCVLLWGVLLVVSAPLPLALSAHLFCVFTCPHLVSLVLTCFHLPSLALTCSHLVSPFPQGIETVRRDNCELVRKMVATSE